MNKHHTDPKLIPPRFQSAYQHIQQLERLERYQAALIFGSLARGEATNESDFDVIVVVDEDNPYSRPGRTSLIIYWNRWVVANRLLRTIVIALYANMTWLRSWIVEGGHGRIESK